MQKNSQWEAKVQEIFQVCQDEIKKTVQIGKKMFSASKTNSDLHEAYEKLGHLTAQALESGELKWQDPHVKKLIDSIQSYEENLVDIENEVNKIKSPPPPPSSGKEGEKG